MKPSELDNFTRHYLIAALWSSIGDDDQPLDSKYSISDIAPAALKRAAEDCKAFQEKAAGLLAMAYASPEYERLQYHPDCGGKLDSMAGHDFWLSRNGHGAGFFDRGNKSFWRGLQNVARQAGQVDLYEGDADTDGIVTLYF